jgi:uncharacterized protein (TIGR00369 family)
MDERVNVVFSHIRPQPGIGYDERRYVSLWGPLRRAEEGLEFTPEREQHWDEQEMSFFELSERGVPQARKYLDRLSEDTGREVRPRLSFGWLFLRATRLPFLTATFVPVLLGIAGSVLGAFQAAMLYDTVGPALLATLPPDQFQSTLQFNVNFLRPVRPGRITGKGRIVHRDGDLAFLEASLADADGAVTATATATARVIPRSRAPAAA